jgi:arylsulfatase A-like enzyme
MTAQLPKLCRGCLVLFAAVAVQSSATRAIAAEHPNIVWIMADDLGYGDVGCYGQQRIKTPHIDRLAAEGVRFTNCYAGSTVCAPSRCTLMTGLHTGHARVRGNANMPLEPADVTVAELLKGAGYSTGIIGKWGLGEPNSTGVPNRQGFDYWFGYLNQKHAHNYYPDYLWRNEQRVPLAGNVVQGGVATQRAQYSHDLFVREALDFLARNKDQPFFLYLPFTIPHANNEAGKRGMEVPSDAPYSAEAWPQPQKNFAAMITRLDAGVGQIMAKLKELGLDTRTIVFFTSDNGPHKEGGGDPKFFSSSGPLRGHKRDLYEGGIRVPMIVRWPGHVAPHTQSDLPWAFWDFLPTACELVGVAPPANLDGLSVVPELLGEKLAGRVQPRHEYLYWEFHERGTKQAVRMDKTRTSDGRMGDWKAIRFGVDGPIELYDMRNDVAEAHDVAAEHPDVIARVKKLLAAARTDSPKWPLQAGG